MRLILDLPERWRPHGDRAYQIDGAPVVVLVGAIGRVAPAAATLLALRLAPDHSLALGPTWIDASASGWPMAWHAADVFDAGGTVVERRLAVIYTLLDRAAAVLLLGAAAVTWRAAWLDVLATAQPRWDAHTASVAGLLDGFELDEGAIDPMTPETTVRFWTE
jgi:hypothetical protein